MVKDDELLTMKDVADFLKISIHTVYKKWPTFGIKPVVAYPGAKPRFWRSELLKMIESHK